MIFSDSLSAIQSIETGHTTSRPSLLRQLYEVIYDSHHDISLAWIPAHVGVQGNELADHLAKAGTTKPQVEIDTELETTEMYSQICKYCEEKWQMEWSQLSYDQYYKIHPNVKMSIQPRHTNRRLEVISNRLRFGRCGLNAYLHEMKIHETGLCDLCNKPETVRHYIMECKNHITTYIKDICQERNIEYTLESILNNRELLQAVFTVNKRDL